MSATVTVLLLVKRDATLKCKSKTSESHRAAGNGTNEQQHAKYNNDGLCVRNTVAQLYLKIQGGPKKNCAKFFLQ